MYEAAGDKFGRGIRYGEAHPEPAVQSLVLSLHEAAQQLASAEQFRQRLEDRATEVALLAQHAGPDQQAALEVFRRENEERLAELRVLDKRFRDVLLDTKRMIEDMELDD
jgi:hypothetical protein